MATVNLDDILGLIEQNKAEFDKAAEGRSSGPSSDWDTADLPLTQEYRVKVIDSEVRDSKAGNTQIVMTVEVLEPVEYAGKKFQDYINPKPTNDIGAKALAQLFGALRADATGLGKDDMPIYAQRFIDKTLVVTLRRWGDANDRTSIRWTNYDNGQELRDDIKPQPAKKAAPALRPDINIPRIEVGGEPFPAVTPPVVTPPSVSVPNLPPGLRTS